MTEDEPTRAGPSLRIATLAITNFRSFRARTVLPFAEGAAEPDRIVTLHGDNGTGKSNAIAALDLFFLALTTCLAQGDESGELMSTWDAEVAALDGRTLVVSNRDRPTGTNEPTEIEVGFQDLGLGTIRVRFTPSGKRVRVRMEHREPAGAGFTPYSREERDQLATWLQTPLGPASRPLAILSERRNPTWLPRANQGSLLHPALAEQLFAVSTDLDPSARERWRAFGETLQRFPQFKGKVIQIQRRQKDGVPELIVEEPRRTVLRLDELSSGEQQILAMYATVVLAAAPLVIVEEPELSLDDKNQRTFRGLLTGLVDGGQVDQIILESHVAAFDDEHVLRFRRSDTGSTEVKRGPSVGEEESKLRERAKEKGAKQRWVTSDGYTQIPDNMRSEMQLRDGGHVWFVKGARHWEAWPEAELDELFQPEDAGHG